MANSFFDPTTYIANIQNDTGADADDINSFLTELENSFDEVETITDSLQTQVNLKANTDSPILTGVPEAPTAATSVDNTQVATTNYVHNLVAEASGVSLPAQAGKAGYFLSTDGTNPSFTVIPTQLNAQIDQRTTITVLGVTDFSHYIEFTSSTATDLTQTFTSAVTLGDEWSCYIKNNSSYEITLDPNASETIDGLASFVMYPGECRLVMSNGTNLFSQVIQPFYNTWLATGTFVTPPGYKNFGGLIWSGGASGQRTNNVAVLSVGGAGGGCSDFYLPASLFGVSETLTIGAGGVAVTTVADGNVGGNSSIGSLLTVYGPTTFTRGGSILTGLSSDGVSNYGADIGGAYSHASMYAGQSSCSGATVDAKACIYGSGQGGSLNASAVVRIPGTSVFGGTGGIANSATDGVDGEVPGGGGGATQTGTSSGKGGDGKIIIWGIV